MKSDNKYNKNEVIAGVMDFLDTYPDAAVVKEIAGQLNQLQKNEEEQKNAVIYTNSPMATEDLEKIRLKLAEIFGHEVQVKQKKDISLLGGFKIVLGDWIYDASIYGQLQSFKDNIYANE